MARTVSSKKGAAFTVGEKKSQNGKDRVKAEIHFGRARRWQSLNQIKKLQ